MKYYVWETLIDSGCDAGECQQHPFAEDLCLQRESDYALLEQNQPVQDWKLGN